MSHVRVVQVKNIKIATDGNKGRFETVINTESSNQGAFCVYVAMELFLHREGKKQTVNNKTDEK